MKRWKMLERLISIFCLFFLPSLSLAAEPIIIGAFFDLTGPVATVGIPTKLVAEMVVDQINKGGGIRGRPVHLIVYSYDGDLSKAITIAKKLIQVDKVDAIIGPDSTGAGMTVKPIIEENEIPTVMTVGGDAPITVPPFKWVFKSPQRSSTAVKKIFEFLKEKGIKRIALATGSSPFGDDGRKHLLAMAPSYGVQIVGDERFGPKDTDMSSQLTRIKGKDAQVLVVWEVGPASSIIAKNYKQLGMKLPLIQCHGMPDPIYIKLAGEAAEGTIFPSTKLMAADQLPETDRQKELILHFIDLYNNVYHHGDKFPLNTHTGYAWDAIKILANAIEKVDTDKHRLREAIEQTRNYVGISGIYNITPQDHNGLDIDSMVVVQIQNGKWKLIKY